MATLATVKLTAGCRDPLSGWFPTSLWRPPHAIPRSIATLEMQALAFAECQWAQMPKPFLGDGTVVIFAAWKMPCHRWLTPRGVGNAFHNESPIPTDTLLESLKLMNVHRYRHAAGPEGWSRLQLFTTSFCFGLYVYLFVCLLLLLFMNGSIYLVCF